MNELSKRLRVASVTCADWRIDRMRPPLGSWAELMEEAADMIDSFTEEDAAAPLEGAEAVEKEYTEALQQWIAAKGENAVAVAEIRLIEARNLRLQAQYHALQG